LGPKIIKNAHGWINGSTKISNSITPSL
jgi:hypothetical protein